MDSILLLGFLGRPRGRGKDECLVRRLVWVWVRIFGGWLVSSVSGWTVGQGLVFVFQSLAWYKSFLRCCTWLYVHRRRPVLGVVRRRVHMSIRTAGEYGMENTPRARDVTDVVRSVVDLLAWKTVA